MLTIAVSKGRIYDEALPLLADADIVPLDDPKTSRKLILKTNHDDVQLVIIRATDVPTFVEYGAADLGIAGKDVRAGKVFLLYGHTLYRYDRYGQRVFHPRRPGQKARGLQRHVDQ
jgi:ATP phosphoribosyltransferase